MEAKKLGAKIILVIFEYVFLVAAFFPYLVFLGIMQLIYAAIDNSHYKAKMNNTEDDDRKRKKAITDQKIDQDRARRKTLADRIVNYWTEHLFRKNPVPAV